tara:strand:- start:1778 stop:2002 length:225 start_codon:yes stop_codon:yes gene_type:complete
MVYFEVSNAALQSHKSKYNYVVVVKFAKFLESVKTLLAVAREFNPALNQAFFFLLCFRLLLFKYWPLILIKPFS